MLAEWLMIYIKILRNCSFGAHKNNSFRLTIQVQGMTGSAIWEKLMARNPVYEN
jgi:hypothetical protein